MYDIQNGNSKMNFKIIFRLYYLYISSFRKFEKASMTVLSLVTNVTDFRNLKFIIIM